MLLALGRDYQAVIKYVKCPSVKFVQGYNIVHLDFDLVLGFTAGLSSNSNNLKKETKELLHMSIAFLFHTTNHGL